MKKYRYMANMVNAAQDDDVMRRNEEAYLDVPDVTEPEEASDSQFIIELDLDADITMQDDMSWTYADESYPWATNPERRSGDWYSDDPKEFVDTPEGIVEDTDILLQTVLPVTPGDYHISGQVTLVFDITGAQYTIGPDDEPEYVDNSATIRFNVEESRIDNFTLQ